MKFYTTFHKYYCGIDLHARILYACIIDERGNKVVHQKIKADKHELLKLISPYLEDIVIGVECMHCWYWVVIYVLSMILILCLVMRFA